MRLTLSQYKDKEYFNNVVLRNNRLNYRVIKGLNKHRPVRIIGMIRLRNEALILQDTLDHMGEIVDGIVIYDDASTDKSVEIAKSHPKVLEIIVNKKWQGGQREWEETANRSLLYERSRRYSPEWFFYADADERFEGKIRQFLLEDCPDDVEGIKISLFDAYITKTDKAPYKTGMKLYNFRKKFGVERRDILMIWRNGCDAEFLRKDGREPQGSINKNAITKFYCQHYGKSLSIQHWEETCDYYINYFPKYKDKWLERKGKAVHDASDFGRDILLWKDVKRSPVVIN
jgi:glycosyltransferase involved in cell wall biosynthesis